MDFEWPIEVEIGRPGDVPSIVDKPLGGRDIPALQIHAAYPVEESRQERRLVERAPHGDGPLAVHDGAIPFARAGVIFDHDLHRAQFKQRRIQLGGESRRFLEVRLESARVCGQCREHRRRPVRRPRQIPFAALFGQLHGAPRVGPRPMRRPGPQVNHQQHAMRARQQRHLPESFGDLYGARDLPLRLLGQTERLQAVTLGQTDPRQ